MRPSSSSGIGGIGRWPSIHRRSSARNSCSSGVSLKSTLPLLGALVDGRAISSPRGPTLMFSPRTPPTWERPGTRAHDPEVTPGARRGMMKATFTEEQQQLADLAERMAERIGADARSGGDPDAGWPLLVDSGLVGLRLPAAAGGGAASAVEVAIVAEALGPARRAGPLHRSRSGRRPPGVRRGPRRAPRGGGHRATTHHHRPRPVALRPPSGDVNAGGTAMPSGGTPAGPSRSWDWCENPTGRSRVALSPGTGAALESSDLTRQLVRVGTAAPTVVGGPLAEAALLRWEALGLVLLCADMVGAMAGSSRRRRLRKRARPVQTAHRLVPGDAAPGRRSAREHRGVPQRHLLRRLGR